MHHSALSTGLIAKVVLVTAAIAGLLYLLAQVLNIVGLFLVAVLFALALAPAVNWLNRHHVPRSAAILLCYLGIGGVIFGIGLLIVPPLVEGVENLSDDIPGYVEDLRQNETFREYDDESGITEELQKQAQELPSRLGDAAGTLRDVTVGVFSSFVQLFSILVIAFFLLMDGDRILAWFFRQFSPRRSARLRHVAGSISDAIAGYVFGNFVISVLAGLVTYVTLTILDVPFAVPLAILFAFFDLVPLVGATVGGILIAIVVAIAADFPIDLIVWAIVFVVYQQIENNLVQPYVYGRTVQIHPLAVIVAILIGGSLLGILGALVAIPAAATVQAILRDWWIYRSEDESTVAVEDEPPTDLPPPDATPAPA